MEKDYSLLRQFDLEAAKRGEKICNFDGAELWNYVAGPDTYGILCVEIKSDKSLLCHPDTPASCFRMSPLAWVEGRPVYRGDVLYHNRVGGDKFVAEKVSANAMDDKAIYCDRGNWLSSCELTWQKPKTKREGWIETCGVKHHKSKEDAERNRTIGWQIMYAHWEE